MQETWRWFGPDDGITLRHIAQAGATGIVSALHDIPAGELWPQEAIQQRKAMIEAEGLSWSVIESIPVHNDIKARTGDFERMIENYRQSVINAGNAGVTTICYNFMPVVDWTRTNLNYTLPNGSQALRFEMADFAAYDIHVLKRPGAEGDYPPEVLTRAETYLQIKSSDELAQLERNIIAGLPGGEGSHDRDSIRQSIELFNALGTERYRENLFLFLQEVIPTAESVGVKMCIHPDDPPFSLFGLPRVVSTAEDARALLGAYPSPSNGLTMCAGSFGARADNDLVSMTREFAERIYFVHLRNVIREADGSFYESDHLDGDNDMVGLIRALLEEEGRRHNSGTGCEIPMRPDHGHLMADELQVGSAKPGYSYVGRLKGLAELRGVIHALKAIS
ncbi:mannonate dehydratase [Microbulbifer elongatus]|uniref:Mannonate dehydratase n=1 Tax=Microbulbifer elongatus TaxID=86173 RepID=A0ABT1NXL7_9GAMM|nr:mannonate dehydratase [Microbulbifer elongatus]MCQ3828630.1 mannonate dehydratase [Microbulbifer elongatus]